MKKRIKIFPRTVVIWVSLFMDTACVLLAGITSYAIRFKGFNFPEVNYEAYLHLLLFIILTRCISFYIFHMYYKQRHTSPFETFISAVKACTASSLVIILFLYFQGIEYYPRGAAILDWIFTIIFITSWRVIVKYVLGLIFGKDLFHAHLLIIGTGMAALKTSLKAQRSASIRYNVVGFLATNENAAVEVPKEDIIGTLGYLPFIVEKCYVDEVVIAEENLNEPKLPEIIQLLDTRRIPLTAIPELSEEIVRNIVLHETVSPFVGSHAAMKPPTWYWGVKRTLDIIASFALLVITAPLLLLAILLIKLTSPGPVFYSQKRMGLHANRFTIIKLRTMYIDAESDGLPRWADKEDTRITPVGKWLRRFRIDELPQLLNVLKNEMSLIGPRPERPYFYSSLTRRIPFYAERLLVKPGLTGWAQIKFQYAGTEKEAEEKLLYDLYYIQNLSFPLDMLIALSTVKVVLTGQGAH